jgi:folate-binding protein YgfZ
MSEALEKVEEEVAAATQVSPLDGVHERAGAVMRTDGGWRTPAHYGDVGAEYRAVRGGAGAGLFDLSSRGRIEVSGAEAVQFLNGMITNDVAKLEDGAWMHAAFPNAQGRLVASVRVLRRGGSFLFDTEPATHERVLKTLERFTLAGDFHVRDLTRETALLSVQGAGAKELIGAALGDGAASVERGRASAVEFEGETLVAMRATHTAEDGFDLIVGADAAEALWLSLTTAGARPCGFDALEVLRIEAGVARYGVDVTDANVVLEAVREEEAVSYTKGCYIGQEIIARIHWRGHVAKKLTGLIFDRDVDAPAHATVKTCAGDREIGRLTSVTHSPTLRRIVALGIVKYDHLAPGTEVKVFDGEREVCAAHVAELPLVRGSWYRPATETAKGESNP